jgi:uracil-DNA glycosylase
MATIHPSAVLRAPDHDSREREYQGLVKDLKQVKQALDEG